LRKNTQREAPPLTYRRGVAPSNPKDLPDFLRKEIEKVERAFSGISSKWTDITGIPANVTAIGALAGAADEVPYFTGVGAMALASLTPYARTILACANVAAARTALGLGSAALNNTGDFDAAGTATAAVAAITPRLLTTRSTVVITTAALASLGVEALSAALTQHTMALLTLQADRACWVRFYASAAAQTADAARLMTAVGTAGTGLLGDFRFAAAATILVSPVAVLANEEAPAQLRVWYTIQNLSGALSTVTATLTVIPLEP
jgi:hypothetical protein